MTFFFFFDNDIEFFTTTSIQKQTGQTQVKSSSFIRALNDYKKEESEKKIVKVFLGFKWSWNEMLTKIGFVKKTKKCV